MASDKRGILDTDIYAITAEEFSREKDNIEVVEEMLEAGIKLIQYREKNKSDREKYKQCQKIRQLTREAECKLIINDDVALAMLVDADGVHLGQDDFPLEEVRKTVRKDMIIGLSTHSPAQGKSAQEIGADYIGVGPVFATNTKEDVVLPVGLEYVEFAANNLEVPFVAIGGIKAHNIEEVKKKGAYCFAMVTEIVGAIDIREKVKEIRSIIST